MQNAKLANKARSKFDLFLACLIDLPSWYKLQLIFQNYHQGIGFFFYFKRILKLNFFFTLISFLIFEHQLKVSQCSAPSGSRYLRKGLKLSMLFPSHDFLPLRNLFARLSTKSTLWTFAQHTAIPHTLCLVKILPSALIIDIETSSCP